MQMMKVNDLIPHPRNTEFFDDMTGEKWNEFLESVKTSGVIEPIVITQDKVIVSGHQRVRACKELGIDEVLADTKHYDNDDAVLKDLIETNVRQRGSIGGSDIKLGNRIRELERIYGIKHGNNQHNEDRNNVPTQQDLAKQLGISERTLRNAKTLTSLPLEIQDLVEQGTISPSTASRLIARLTPEEQEKLVVALPVVDRLTQKQVQKYIDQIKTKDNKISGYEMMMEEYQKQIANLREQLKSIEKTDLNEQESKYEIERLKKKIADLIFEKNELENKHTETVVQTVEVDRQETLKKIEDLEKQLKSTDEINANLSKQIIEDAEKLSKFMGTDTNYKLVSHCSDITMRITDFLKEMSQLDYMAESFNEIPIATRREYKRCITSVKKWVDRILEVIDMEENVVDYEVIND